MSKFYGQVCGNRSAATRGGSKASGFQSSCQSYDGSICISMDYYDSDGKEVLMCRVGTNDRSSCHVDYSTPVFNGTFEEFKDLLRLQAKIKNGEVSVVRHKKRKEV